jgi:diguanylate cyclase (GGDEF)-like protein
VRLHATVGFYDEYLDAGGTPVFFVFDSSGSIYVALDGKPASPLRPGDLVEVTGVSSPGLFAPIVSHAQVQVVGRSPLPTSAPRVSLGDMLTGSDDGQWVEVEGLVQAVRNSGPHVILDLLLGDGAVTAVTGRQSGVDYSFLVDSGIVLRGIASPNFNKQRQVTGAHLLFPGLDSIRVVEAGAADPYKLPLQEINTLLRFTPDQTFRHEVHVRGVLTLLWPGQMICIEDGSKSLCAQTKQKTPLHEGDLVDLVGFPAIGDFTPSLVHAWYSFHGGRAPMVSAAITARQALSGDRDSSLVTIDARLIDDHRSGAEHVLTLSSDGFVFTASLPNQLAEAAGHPFEAGSLLRVTGICSVEAGASEAAGEGFTIPQSFRILESSPSDVVVLERPSWWNAERTLRVLALAVTLMGLALATIVLLRLRIKQQTATIRAQLAETAALKDAAEFQAMHDSLTALFNRKAIFQALRRELTLAARSGTTTGVLMLDLDHFKRVNDTYGHYAGDCVIKESVRRILDSVRSSDLVGRYGGEEFLVVLPDCDRRQTEACAERVRAAVAAAPVQMEAGSLAVTVSIGAVSASDPVTVEQEILSAADRALYDAKHSGRNRVVFRDLHPTSQGQMH